jgi:ribosome biogenesis GTPase
MSKHEQTSGRTGLVISYFGNSVAVEAADGQVFQCHLKRNQPLPVVGDKVLWQIEKENSAIIISIEPRRSILERGDVHGQKKPIAANVDVMAVVMAPLPVFSDHLIDRYLVAAEILNISPLLVLNKIDLLADDRRQALEQQMQRYQQIGYPVLMTSVKAQIGLTELANFMNDKISVLVGPSGVGKSTIISALAGEAIRTGDVSSKGIGKHTTTATRFYHLPKGGGLIDSPGVRDFSLWSVSPEEVLAGFRELKPYLTGCKFRDCRHLVEPGCMIQQAVSKGLISTERYANYQTLMKEAVKR